MKFLLSPRGSFRPSLIVETKEAVTKAAQGRLRDEMYRRSCPNGILFDTKVCVVLRDTFEDMGPDSVKAEPTLDTDIVLSLVQGANLDDKVQTWLELLSASWSHAIPTDPAVSMLMYDVVPAAVGAEIHVVRERQ